MSTREVDRREFRHSLPETDELKFRQGKIQLAYSRHGTHITEQIAADHFFFHLFACTPCTMRTTHDV